MQIVGKRTVLWRHVRRWYQELAASPDLVTYSSLPSPLNGVEIRIDGVWVRTRHGQWQVTNWLYLAGDSTSLVSIADRALILLTLLEAYPPVVGSAPDTDNAEIAAVRAALVAVLAKHGGDAVVPTNHVVTATGPRAVGGIGLANTGEVVVLSGGKWFSADGSMTVPVQWARW